MMGATTFLTVVDYDFVNPEFLWGLLVIPVLVFLYYKYFRFHTSAVRVPGNHTGDGNWFGSLKDVMFHLQMLGLAGLIAGMAQPQDSNKKKTLENSTNEGIDIMIAMDVSGSMMAQDFKPNRLVASVDVAKEFIDNRPNDRIGLTVYGGEALLISPVTTDHMTLKEKLDEISTEMVSPATAIGDGLDMAGAGLYNSTAKSKVVILLTDGVNNAGNVNPMDAAANAKAFNIKVYTIGMGKPGESAPFPVDYGGMTIMQSLPVEIDEQLMENISEATEGEYFLAEDEGKLRDIYSEIDRLEKSRFESSKITIDPPEEFRWYVIPGLLLILVPFIVNRTLMRQIP